MPIQPPVIEQADPAVLTAWYGLFLAQFPEFSNTALYPVSMVQAWVAPAVEQMNQYRFGDQYNLVVSLFIAHNVALSARELKASRSGNSVVGEAYGPVASKTIDKLSISYGATASIDGAGVYNLTSYGQRLYKLIQSFSSGPFYVGRPRWRR